jgi:hypothetical protein
MRLLADAGLKPRTGMTMARPLARSEPDSVTTMKNFPIGDGQKRISCPDRYLADREDNETTLLWDPQNVDILIRATVATITPKDPERRDLGFWAVIDKAREHDVAPIVQENKAIYRYRKPSTEPDTFLHFNEVGLGNHICLFSITVSGADETTFQFAQIQTDVEGMISTLVERKDDEQFSCNLLGWQRNRIADSVQSLLGSRRDEEAWDHLQAHLERAYGDADEELTRSVGLAFGELMRSEIPSLTWACRIDEYGTGLALDLAGTTISIFPEDMILKRFDRREPLDLKEFSADTVDMLERIFRELNEE